MISNSAALAALTAKPKIDEINLKLLQNFYKDYLNPYRYTFERASGIYAPRTFLIETITETNTGTKFIDPQLDDPVPIIKTTKTLRNVTQSPSVGRVSFI